MPKVTLTAKGLDGLTSDAPRTDYWDRVAPGLVVRVSGVTSRSRSPLGSVCDSEPSPRQYSAEVFV